MSSPEPSLPGPAARVLEACAGLGPHPLVLIDGPSGAGKSSLATAVAAGWAGAAPLVLVRMDDLYPGWSGLRAGAEHVLRELILPRASGHSGRWRSHDWASGTPGEWTRVPADVPLLVEGCGALNAGARAAADLAVWVEADDTVRQRRALARDHGAFDPFWEMWERQFAQFVRAERPRPRADLVFDTTGD